MNKLYVLNVWPTGFSLMIDGFMYAVEMNRSTAVAFRTFQTVDYMNYDFVACKYEEIEQIRRHVYQPEYFEGIIGEAVEYFSMQVTPNVKLTEKEVQRGDLYSGKHNEMAIKSLKSQVKKIVIRQMIELYERLGIRERQNRIRYMIKAGFPPAQYMRIVATDDYLYKDWRRYHAFRAYLNYSVDTTDAIAIANWRKNLKADKPLNKFIDGVRGQKSAWQALAYAYLIRDIDNIKPVSLNGPRWRILMRMAAQCSKLEGFQFVENSSYKDVTDALKSRMLWHVHPRNNKFTDDCIVGAFRYIRDALNLRETYHMVNRFPKKSATFREWITFSVETHNLSYELARQRMERRDTKLAEPSWGDENIPGLTRFKLTGDMIDEGNNMHHCISSYRQHAIEGDSFFYHYKYQDYECSAQVSKEGTIIQAHGPYNEWNESVDSFRQVWKQFMKGANS